MRGDQLPPGCGTGPRCPWGCEGCPRSEYRPPPPDAGYFACPKCRERAAFWDVRANIVCRMCGTRFHRDFANFIEQSRVVPDPPRKDEAA